MLADLVGPGTEIVVARGGRGGLGNAALASSKRKAPGFALLGEPGDELEIVLELKVVADVGLVGFPSAGKSSLIAAISRARPKIADYPFTTLVPNLGVVTAGEATFTVADVPGLIEGASEGRGLGHEFLRHVERCAALVHVIDTATIEPGRNPVDDLDVIERELGSYGGLEDRPRLVALNKIDVPDGRDLADIVLDDLQDAGSAGLPGQRRLGGGAARADLRDGRDRRRGPGREAESPRPPGSCCARRRPTEATTSPSSSADEGWQVRGTKPERWVRQTDFSNDEAVGFLADRLNRLGVEERLLELGAQEGDTVLIGAPRRRRGLRLQAGHRRRCRDPRPPRRGPALRGVAPGRPAPPRHRGGDDRSRRGRAARRRRAPPRPRPHRPEMPTGPSSYESLRQARIRTDDED